VKAHTKVESDLDARIAAFQGDGERVDVLQRARRFKASWIELGESLSHVMKEERWKRWGYSSFEDYCTKELHLKRETAYKLTGSYTFLKARAPEVLRRDGLRAPIPPLESVSFWQRAEEEAEDAPPEQLRELRRAVVDEGAPAAALKRRYKEVFFPTGDEDKDQRDRSSVLSAAQRLLTLLAESKAVPTTLAADVEEQLGRLIQELSN
jgi:hypothetical protein